LGFSFAIRAAIVTDFCGEIQPTFGKNPPVPDPNLKKMNQTAFFLQDLPSSRVFIVGGFIVVSAKDTSNMTPNEQPSRFGQPPAEIRRPVPENMLKHEQLHVERKTFLFMLKENERGRFLRVTENAGEHIASLMIPSSGLADFKKAVD
jgi:PurA ssDNA and RNA-binding protein